MNRDFSRVLLSFGRDLVVEASAITVSQTVWSVGAVTISSIGISSVSVVTVVGIGLWLSISGSLTNSSESILRDRLLMKPYISLISGSGLLFLQKKNQPLSVVSGVADGGVAIWVSSETIVSQTIGVSTTESTVAVSSIQIGSIGLGLSISGPLGNMDNTSRVSNVSSGSGVQSGGSRDGSGGSSGDSNAVGNIGDSVTGGIAEVRGGVGRDSGIRIASQATVGEASIPVWAVESVSIS